MKTQNIAVLVLVGGLFATSALAENSVVASDLSSAPAAVPNQIIYVPQLPAVPELTAAAKAQSLTIKQIVQSPRDLTITYQFADSQSRIVAYRLLTDAGARVAPPPPPTVVYAPPYPYYYYDPFYSEYWYPPFSVRLGFGFRAGGFRGGGFRGGRR